MCVVRRPMMHLDVGGVDLGQQDLLRLQAAQFTELLLQSCVLLIHVQPQAVTHGGGAVQLDHCAHTHTHTGVRL